MTASPDLCYVSCVDALFVWLVGQFTYIYDYYKNCSLLSPFSLL